MSNDGDKSDGAGLGREGLALNALREIHAFLDVDEEDAEDVDLDEAIELIATVQSIVSRALGKIAALSFVAPPPEARGEKS
jgi:hypothetical protein